MKLAAIKTRFFKGLPDSDVSMYDICETELAPDSGIFSDLSNDIVSPPSGMLELKLI